MIKTNDKQCERDSYVRKLTSLTKSDFLKEKETVAILFAKRREMNDRIFSVNNLIDSLYAMWEKTNEIMYWQEIQEAKKRKRGYEDLLKRTQLYIEIAKGKQTVDIEEIKGIPIGNILTGLRWQTKNRAKFLCPIHNENTPSFVWYKDNNSFYCFGCHTGGSNIDLIMKRDGVDLVEALKTLQHYL